MKTSLLIVALTVIFVSQAEAERGRGSPDLEGPKLVCVYKNSVTLPIEIPLVRQNTRLTQNRVPYRQKTPNGEVVHIGSEDYGSDGQATVVTFKLKNNTQFEAQLDGSDSIQFDSTYQTDLASCSVKDAKQVFKDALEGPNFRGRLPGSKPEKYYAGGSLRDGRVQRMKEYSKYDHLLPNAPAGQPAQTSEAATDSAE